MKFVNKLQIILSKIPKYVIFNSNFIESIDYELSRLILESNDERLTEQMKDLYRNKVHIYINSITNEIKVKYKPAGKIGRRYAVEKGSLTVHSKFLKNTIFYFQKWRDIDAIKGHPTIIYYIAKKNGINLHSYEQYLAEGGFDAICNDLIDYYSVPNEIPLTKNNIKDLINRTIYGGGHSSWVQYIEEGNELKGHLPIPVNNSDKPHPFYLKFKADTKLITEIIINSNEELVNELKKENEDDWVTNNRVMSYFCQIIENEATYEVYKYCVLNKLCKERQVSWGYDGFTMPACPENTDFDFHLNEINKYVFQKIGLPLTYKWKSFDEDTILFDVIEQRNNFILPIAMPIAEIQGTVIEETQEIAPENLNLIIVKNDTEAGRYMCSILKDKYIYLARHGYYYKHNNIWINDKIQIDSLVNEEILMVALAYPLLPNKTQNEMYCKNIRQMKNVAQSLDIFIKNRNDTPDIYDKFHTTTKNRLCFLDGVLDFKEKHFHTWDVIQFEYYTTIQINRNYKEFFDNPNMGIVEQVKNEVYRVCYGADVDTALQFLSRAITGNPQDKKYGVLIGNRNCGKGVQYSNLKAGGGDYVKTFELGNVLYNRSTDTQETSRMNYWLLDFEFTRLAISQEIPKEEAGYKLDGKKWKKICGGDDEQISRRNYDRVDTTYKIDSTFFIMGNNKLLYDNPDIQTEEILFQSIVQFKTEAELNQMRENGVEDCLINAYHIKNDDIKDVVKTDVWANAVIWLLYLNWQPISVCPLYIEDDTEDMFLDLKQRILLKYMVSPNKKDMISCAIVEGEFEENKKKICMELNNLGIIKKRIKNEVYRDTWCYIGIRIRGVEEEKNN